MRPVVSIVIPTYNRAHLISETLESVLRQSFELWECIVIDDGSTDNTEEVVNDYASKDSRFRYQKRPDYKVKGPSSCRNFGFSISSGEYVTWFDSDDILMPRSIETRLSFFNKDVDAVVCKLQFFDFNKNVVLKETTIVSPDRINDYLIGNIVYYVSGPIWKKEFLLKQKEIFDENLSNLDDWDFNLRMLYAKPNLIFLNEPLIKYRIHTESLSQEIYKLNFDEIKSEFKARIKHFKLLRCKKDIDMDKYKNFVVRRNKSFLREALISDNEAKYYLYKSLLIIQLLSFDVKGVLRSTMGFISYNMANKGYCLFK